MRIISYNYHFPVVLIHSTAANAQSTPTPTPTASVSDMQVALEIEEGDKEALDVRMFEYVTHTNVPKVQGTSPLIGVHG